MVKRRLDGALRFVKHPNTNGFADGLNSKIMSVKRKADGFRNAQNLTVASSASSCHSARKTTTGSTRVARRADK